MKTPVRYRAFGKHNNPTIYYLPGYGDGNQIKGYRPHIYTLVLAGFRVVAFEYSWEILQSGDPNTLIDALKDIEAMIQKDKKGRAVAGVYGVSLGSWMGANILTSCSIQRGVFNTGGADLAEAIWKRPRPWKERKAFKENGYTQEYVRTHWKTYEPAQTGSFLKNKKVLLMVSTKDELFDIAEARTTVAQWQGQSNDVRVVETKGLSHARAIARHMLRATTVKQFFKS